MAQPHATTEKETNAIAIREDDIAVLAYALWEKRGHPIGSPEEDWFQAERALRLKKLTRGFGERLSTSIANAAK